MAEKVNYRNVPGCGHGNGIMSMNGWNLVGDFFLVMLEERACVFASIPGAWVRLQICKDRTPTLGVCSVVLSSMQSVQLVTSHLQSIKTLSTSRPLIRGSAMGSDQVRSGGPFFLFVSITRVWTSALWLAQLGSA
jgi:hypothetical protein